MLNETTTPTAQGATKISFQRTTRDHFYSGFYAQVDKACFVIRRKKIGNYIAKGIYAGFIVTAGEGFIATRIILGEVKTLPEAKALCANYLSQTNS